MKDKKELGGIVQEYDTPYITQEGMQKNLSTFDLGGMVHSYYRSPFPIFGNLQVPNRNLILEGDMFSGDMMMANGGKIDEGERSRDMEEINSIIEEYRDCMKRKAMCDATNKYAQSCVYKDKAISCKKKASKLISKYREKYGRTESGDWMKFNDGGKVKKQEDAVDAAKEKLNESFSLPIEMAVYVPSTKGADEKISDAEFRQRIEETERYLSSQFGGFSKVDIHGGYVSQEKGLIKEDVAKVVAFAQDEDFLTNRLPRLIKRITLWCDDWTQESIGFEMEGDLFYIDKDFEYDKEKFSNGGQTDLLYSVYDEDGDVILMGVTEQRLIEYANVIFYYDVKDSGESDINTLEDAIKAMESVDYEVKSQSTMFAKGGLSEHGLKAGDKILKGENIGSVIRVKNEDLDESAKVDLDTGKRNILAKGKKTKRYGEKMADGGGVFRADDKLLGIKHKKGDNFVDREKNRVTRKLQLLKDNPQVLAGGMPTKFADGGEFKGGGVTKKLKRVVRKGKKYGNLAIKKAKPKAKKIVRKLKIGFDALAKKVAKSYEGKAVAPKYQKEYGKRYSKEEAQEVGKKVAAKVKRMKGM